MFTRRDALKTSVGGASAFYLQGFLRQATAAPRQPPPMRVVFFLQGNGLYPDQIQPAGIPRPRSPDRLEDRPLAGHALPESLTPLAPFVDRMALVHGLSSRIATASHSTDFGCLGCYPGNRNVLDETIDSALANRLGGVFAHVGLGVTSKAEESIIYNVSASGRDKKIPTQCQPQAAYRRLFGVALRGEARRAFDARGQVLDFLADDVRRLQGQLDATQRDKLGHYLEALQAMSQRQSTLQTLADRVAASTPVITERYGPQVNWLDRLEAQFDIAAGALIAGLTHVITISSCSGLQFSGGKLDGSQLGLEPGPIDLHGIGHGQSFCGKSAQELHILIRQRHAAHLAKFLARLQAVPEGDGTLLDHTLVVYTSDHGDGHHPTNYEWPYILIGDLAGRLATRGRYLRYPWYRKPGHRTVANLYTTLLHLAGDRRPRFGIPDPALRDLNQNGPLEELLA